MQARSMAPLVALLWLGGCKKEGAPTPGATPQPSAQAPAPAPRPGLGGVLGGLMGGGKSETALRPLAPGQWTRHRVTDASGAVSELTYKVLAQRGNVYDLECVSARGDQRTIIQMTEQVNHRNDPSGIKLESARVKLANGKVMELKGAQTAMVQSMLQTMPISPVPPLAGQPREDVTVGAGTFEGSIRFEQSLVALGKPYQATSWVHSRVPISGTVKTQGKKDRSSTELIAHGDEGAKSEF